jgi:dipeptidase
MKKISILALVVILSLSLTVSPVLACTTVVVGKDATDTGKVLFAHSEELGDSPTHYKSVPRKYYSEGDMWEGISNGTQTTQPAMTFAYIASTIFDKDYYPGDITSGVNENQVTIGNNMSWTKDVPGSTAWDLRDNGIIWTEYTQLVLERARTAEEGIDIISSLHEEHKLSGDPGTMYAVADPNEAWIIELAIDGQWIAKKIDDDEVYTLPNAFTIGVEDLEDNPNIRCSDDLVSYAEGKGWYDPSDGEFSFKDVYGLPSRQADDYNWLRTRMADRMLSSGTVTKKRLMEFMRTAYEGTEYYKADIKTGSPFNTGTRVISTLGTEVSAVVELRGDIPKEIGTTVWWSLATSKTSPYIPYYLGATYFPEEYATTSLDEEDGSAYWAYRNLSHIVDQNYSNVFGIVKKTWDEFEDIQFKNQAAIEAKALSLMNAHSTAAGISYLNNYSNERATLAYNSALDLIKTIKSQLEKPIEQPTDFQPPIPGPGVDVDTVSNPSSDTGSIMDDPIKVMIGQDGIPVLSAAPSAIRPLDLTKIPFSAINIADKTWAGKQIMNGLAVNLTYRLNGSIVTKTLNSNIDYALENPGVNVDIGNGIINVVGKGSYAGTKTVPFKIIPKKNSVNKVIVGKKSAKVYLNKVSPSQKVTGYQLQYRQKGTSKWKTRTVSAKNASVTLKKLKKGKQYQFRVRAYKTVANANYHALWSPVKTGKKIK